MGLEDILAAIRTDTDAEIAEVYRQARDEVSAIEEQARIDGARQADVILEANEVSARREAAQIVIHARGAVERIFADAVEEEYHKTLGRLREELDAIRDTSRYRAVLGVLIDEALGRLPEATVVFADPADVPLVDELLGASGGRAPRIEESGASIGGVTVATGDGRSVHNTFEVRIERADGLLRAIAARDLPDVKYSR